MVVVVVEGLVVPRNFILSTCHTTFLRHRSKKVNIQVFFVSLHFCINLVLAASTWGCCIVTWNQMHGKVVGLYISINLYLFINKRYMILVRNLSMLLYRDISKYDIGTIPNSSPRAITPDLAYWDNKKQGGKLHLEIKLPLVIISQNLSSYAVNISIGIGVYIVRYVKSLHYIQPCEVRICICLKVNYAWGQIQSEIVTDTIFVCFIYKWNHISI